MVIVRGSASFGEARAVLLEFGDDRLRRDRDCDHLAAFFGLADREDFHARARLLEPPHVVVDLFGVGQLAGRAGDVSEHGLRRRHRFRRRQVIGERRVEERLGRVFLDLRRVLGVDRDLRVADERLRLLLGSHRRLEQRRRRGERHHHKLLHESPTANPSMLNAKTHNL